MESSLYETYPEIYNSLLELEIEYPLAFEEVKFRIVKSFSENYAYLYNTTKWIHDTFSKIQQIHILIVSLEAEICLHDFNPEFLLEKREILQMIESRSYMTSLIIDTNRMTNDLKFLENYITEYSKQIQIFFK